MSKQQLHMRKSNMENLPPLSLPCGFSLQSHVTGMESEWEALIEDAFGHHFSFEDCIIRAGGYKPEYVLYLKEDGKTIATATAVEKETFPNEGWFRMVGVSSKARGMGVGRLIALAALHSLAARGYNSVVLSTDDNRIPALRLYLSLGFEPIVFDQEHQDRWDKVMSVLKSKKN